MRSYLLILICLLYGCDFAQETQPPKILNNTEFENILKEIHLAQAAFQLNKNNDLKKSEEILANTYLNIYKKHQISEEKFQNTLDYYSKNPQRLEKIYANILDQLTKEKSKLDQ
tara:strand:- start:1006 stop:1347 length:342 start_codon:yes stop_codon:yes gene_type:complete